MNFISTSASIGKYFTIFEIFNFTFLPLAWVKLNLFSTFMGVLDSKGVRQQLFSQASALIYAITIELIESKMSRTVIFPHKMSENAKLSDFCLEITKSSGKESCFPGKIRLG